MNMRSTQKKSFLTLFFAVSKSILFNVGMIAIGFVFGFLATTLDVHKAFSQSEMHASIDQVERYLLEQRQLDSKIDKCLLDMKKRLALEQQQKNMSFLKKVR